MNTDVQNEQQPESTDETKAWEALQADVGGEGEASSSAESGSPPDQPTGATAENEPAPEQGGSDAEKSRPAPEELVSQYQAGMREERTKRQALEAEISEIKEFLQEARQRQQQPAENEIPSIDEDPVAYFEHQQKQLSSQIEETREAQQAEAKARTEADRQQEFMRTVQQSEQAFAAEAPDYFEAAGHLRSVRLEQLAQVYPDGPAGDQYAQDMKIPGVNTAEDLRNAHLEQEVQMYANSAIKTGQNPARVFYNLAMSTGWKAPQSKVEPQQKIEMARAGAERAQSLSGGGGGGGNAGNSTTAELAQLFIDDPVAADELWSKMYG